MLHTVINPSLKSNSHVQKMRIHFGIIKKTEYRN